MTKIVYDIKAIFLYTHIVTSIIYIEATSEETFIRVIVTESFWEYLLNIFWRKWLLPKSHKKIFVVLEIPILRKYNGGWYDKSHEPDYI